MYPVVAGQHEQCKQCKIEGCLCKCIQQQFASAKAFLMGALCIELQLGQRGAPRTDFVLQALMKWEAEEQQREAALAELGGKAADQMAPAEMQYVAYVPLPDQKEIEQRVLEKKKAELLAKYSSASLVKEQQDAKALLNKR